MSSIIKFDCVDDTHSSSYNDSYTFTAPVFTATALSNYKLIADNYTEIVPTIYTLIDDYIVYTYWILFDSNNYTNNYASCG